MPDSYRLIVQYDGTRYHGWQSQTHGRTIQGTLVQAAAEVFGQGVEIGGAGRTDAGVHALAQVAHLRVPSHRHSGAGGGDRPRRDHPRRDVPGAVSRGQLGQLRSEINRRLPQDIAVLRIEPSPAAFHARHDALQRYYLYQVAFRKSAFSKRFVWWVPERLDIGRIERAAALLKGRHDFAAFGDKRGEKKSTLVEVSEASVAVHGELVLIRIGASHFLWKMVRRLVGAFVEIGKGNLQEGEFERMLRTAQGSAAPWTAPASGLFLERVSYAEGDLPGPLAPVLWA